MRIMTAMRSLRSSGRTPARLIPAVPAYGPDRYAGPRRIAE